MVEVVEKRALVVLQSVATMSNATNHPTSSNDTHQLFETDLFESDLNKRLDEFARKLAKLTDESWAKDLEIEDLRRQEMAAKRQLQDLLEQKEKSLREAQQSHLQEIESLQETNIMLNQQIGQLNTERSQLKDELAQLIHRMREQERNAREKEQQILDTQNQFSEFRSQNERVLKEVESLKADLHQAQQSTHAEKSHVAELQRILEAERRKTVHFEKRAMDLDGVVKTLEQKIKDLLQRRDADAQTFRRLEADRNARIRELESQCAEQANQIEQARDVVASFEQALESNKLSLQNVKEAAARGLHEANQQSAQKIETLLKQQASLNQELTRLRAECSSVESSLVEANEATEAARANCDRLSSENESLRLTLQSRDEELGSEYEKIQARRSELDLHEQKICQMSEAVRKEKSDLFRLAKQLANEMQMARATHPFKDHLGVTDLELSKIQSQLKGATIAPQDRAKLEESLAKLFKKREFLNSVLTSSQKHLEERSFAIMANFQKSQEP